MNEGGGFEPPNGRETLPIRGCDPARRWRVGATLRNVGCARLVEPPIYRVHLVESFQTISLDRLEDPLDLFGGEGLHFLSVQAWQASPLGDVAGDQLPDHGLPRALRRTAWT